MNAVNLPSRSRLFCLIGVGSLLIFMRAFAAEPLPVLMLGAGNWLDRSGTREQINMVLPAEGEPLVLTNSWSQGPNVLASDPQYSGGVLLLSNVWTYASNGVSEEAFWKGQGVTNSPLKLAIPGEQGFYLAVANNRIMPFVGRKGTIAHNAIWAWPKLPVKVDGSTGKSADISRCELVSFEGETIKISGWLAPVGVRQNWRLSVKRGLLCLELVLSPERDY